jgi:hypothetical protein
VWQGKVCIRKKKRGRRFGREGEFFAFRLSLVLEWGVCLCRMLLLLQTGSEDPVYMCQQALNLDQVKG